MEFVRSITTGRELAKGFAVPPNMMNRRLEILILPLEEEKAEPRQAQKKSMYGALAKYANPALIPLEETAWRDSVHDDLP